MTMPDYVVKMANYTVIPAKAGTQGQPHGSFWVPAFAGMTTVAGMTTALGMTPAYGNEAP
jgi:hypothetical protein